MGSDCVMRRRGTEAGDSADRWPSAWHVVGSSHAACRANSIAVPSDGVCIGRRLRLCGLQPVPGRDVLDWIRLANPWGILMGTRQGLAPAWLDAVAWLHPSGGVCLALSMLACRGLWCRLLQPLSAWDVLDWLRWVVAGG